MTTKSLVDAELHKFIEEFPKFDFTDEMMPALREMMAASLGELAEPPASVVREVIMVPGVDGSADVRCYLYKPAKPEANAPAYLHLHGGGMILGSPDQTDERCIKICDSMGVTVLSVDYRLAPEDPYPAALHDCYAGLAYLHNSAEALGIDRSRIAIGGESAGGGLAASLAIFARDKGDYAICYQQLVFPMIDDRTGKEGAEVDPNIGEFVWRPANNQYGWVSYLGSASAENAHIPARTENLSGLPPAWIGVGDLDLFFTENKDYAQRLADAGVPVSFEVYPGAPHGFYLWPEAKVSQKFEVDFMRTLSRGLGVST